MSTDLHVITVAQQDPRLGRQVVHDPRSRRFAFPAGVLPDKPARRIRHRIWGPTPVPQQRVGCCTGVDQAVKCNAAGNRVNGEILGLSHAEAIYRRASTLDPFDGQWPPDDTGSSGLAACKAAAEFGWITRYEWLFAGARQVLAALAGDATRPGRCVGVGTWWTSEMFHPDPETLIVKPAGPRVGGHQWTVTGWDPYHDALEGLCWWGPHWGDRGRFRIRFNDLDVLLADDGDAHVTYRRIV